MHRLTLLFVCLLPWLCGCGLFAPEGVTRVGVADLKPGIIVPQLRPGVKIMVSVSASGQPVFEQQEKEVSVEGDVLLPYVDRVQCGGMTIEVFRKLLVDRYMEFYVDPQVSVDYVPMTQGGSSPYGTVLVTGCVGKPGPVNIPPTRDLTVMQALADAGGIGAWANKGDVSLTRELADGTKQRVIIDLDEIGTAGATELNVILMPGDVLNVPESNW